MTTNYRAELRKLVKACDEHGASWPVSDLRPLFIAAARARTLLAQPEPEGLSDEELLELAAKALGYKSIPSDETDLEADAGELLAFARAAIAADRARQAPPNLAETRRSPGDDSQPPADGELTVNLRMDLSSECLKRLCDGLSAAVKPNGGYRELTTDDDVSGEFIGEQLVGVEWWVPEHGCDSLENTLDSIKGRLLTAVRDWLPTAVTSTPQPPADGEVKELVTLLRAEANDDDKSDHTLWMDGADLRRAAELLQRQHPQPVAVSERLPGAKDMTEDGEVWIEDPGQHYPLADTGDYDWEPHKWILRPIGKFDAKNGLRWLPAHALPVPPQS